LSIVSLPKRIDLSVNITGLPMPPFGDHRTITNHHAADMRVWTGSTCAFAGKFNRPPHPRFIIAH
jgi:hypothetical protein